MTRLRVAVFGASGHGKVVAEVASSIGHELVAFIDDSPTRMGGRVLGIEVVGWESARADLPRDVTFALGVGSNVARAAIARRIGEAGFPLGTFIHASARISPSASVDAGTVVMAGALVNAEARIGAGAIVNTGSIIEHDARIGDYVLIGPGVAMGGNVTIGNFALVGVGARLLPGVRVGTQAVVGGGAVVTKDVPAGSTVVGIPARPMPAR